jgi:hypothetical protein
MITGTGEGIGERGRRGQNDQILIRIGELLISVELMNEDPDQLGIGMRMMIYRKLLRRV